MSVTSETQLENYNLIEELSQDDRVTVYRGQRKSDGAAVLIKIVSPFFASDEFFTWRFKHAAQQAARLEHPNIVAAYEAEQAGDLLYVVQDFVEARSLAQVLAEEGPFSPQRMQFIARQIASVLDYAHQKSITHGDLSAQHIYLGRADHVFIGDFGQTQALFGHHPAGQGQPVSSPETTAPERVRGQGPSRHSDLYALGILGYQMLAGKPPFTGSPAAVLHAQAYRQPTPLYRVNPGISVAISEVIGRMLAKGLELRYNTGAEFARALAVACSAHQRTVQQARSFAPLAGRGHVETRPIRGPVYFYGVGLVILLVALSMAWAGYQLGVNQSTHLVVASATPLPPAGSLAGESGRLEDSDSILSAPVAPPPSTQRPVIADTLLPTPPPGRAFGSLSDSLLPTRSANPLTSDPLLLLPTSTPTPAVRPVAAPRPTATSPLPAIPAGQGRLVFTNPTGHDLIVDLTGPTSASKLVPPYSRAEFILGLGRYQCIIHTPTGHWLASRTLYFDILEGQVAEKDYYTDYDLTLQ